MQNILTLQTIDATEGTNETEMPWSIISLFICG